LHLQGGDMFSLQNCPVTNTCVSNSNYVRLLDDFKMGPNLVRGFQPAGLGPRDITPGTSNDALGGTMYWGASFEMQYPLYFLPKDSGFRGAIFVDSGALWGYRAETSNPATGEINGTITATNTSDGSQASAVTNNSGTFYLALPAGNYRVEASSPGFQRLIHQNVFVNGQQLAALNMTLQVGAASETVEVSAGVHGNIALQNRAYAKLMAPPPPGAQPMIEYESAAAESLTLNTTTAAYDDYFEYKLTDPVTIRKNESALVPILQTKLPVERVTLWSPSQPRALRALWITNSSKLTLDRGSFSIVENGNFGGEGLLDPIHPSERRLLSYAADQAVRVSTDYSHNSQRGTLITVNKGILRETHAEVAEVEYLVRNAAPEARTVIVEQPIRQGWQLDSDPKPAETTPTAYRFRVATQPAETVRLHVGERRTYDMAYRLVDTTDEQLTLILRNANATSALTQQLEPVFAAKRNVASIDTQIHSKQSDINQITEDQKRLRENLSALKGSAEERSLAKRYTEELNQQEDRLATLHKDLDTLHQQREAAQQDLANKIESLSIEEKLT